MEAVEEVAVADGRSRVVERGDGAQQVCGNRDCDDFNGDIGEGGEVGDVVVGGEKEGEGDVDDRRESADVED